MEFISWIIGFVLSYLVCIHIFNIAGKSIDNNDKIVACLISLGSWISLLSVSIVYTFIKLMDAYDSK